MPQEECCPRGVLPQLETRTQRAAPASETGGHPGAATGLPCALRCFVSLRLRIERSRLRVTGVPRTNSKAQGSGDRLEAAAWRQQALAAAPRALSIDCRTARRTPHSLAHISGCIVARTCPASYCNRKTHDDLALPGSQQPRETSGQCPAPPCPCFALFALVRIDWQGLQNVQSGSGAHSNAGVGRAVNSNQSVGCCNRVGSSAMQVAAELQLGRRT